MINPIWRFEVCLGFQFVHQRGRAYELQNRRNYVVASNTHCVVACPGDKTTNHSYLFVSKVKQTKQTKQNKQNKQTKNKQ